MQVSNTCNYLVKSKLPIKQKWSTTLNFKTISDSSLDIDHCVYLVHMYGTKSINSSQFSY